LCVASCPGFVTANVVTCEEVPEWDDCAMAVRAMEPSPAQKREQTQYEGRVASAVSQGLFAVVQTAFAAALEDEDPDHVERKSVDRSQQKKKRRRRPATKRRRMHPRDAH
jgi:hypothetical protein